jgi:hypothetical protein
MAHFFASGYPEDANAYVIENGQVRKVVVRVGAKVHVGLADQSMKTSPSPPKMVLWPALRKYPVPGLRILGCSS